MSQRTKVRIEPRLVPGAEGRIDVGVTAAEPVRATRLDSNDFRARAISAEADFLGEEMRRDQHEAAHAMILHAAGIYRRDRGAVAVAEQEAALKSDGVEHARQHVAASSLRNDVVRGSCPAATGRSRRANRRTRRRRSPPRSRRETSPTGRPSPGPSCSITMVGAASGRGPIMRYSSRSGARSRKPESASITASCFLGDVRATARRRRNSLAKLCSTVSPDVSTSASARA